MDFLSPREISLNQGKHPILPSTQASSPHKEFPLLLPNIALSCLGPSYPRKLLPPVQFHPEAGPGDPRESFYSRVPVPWADTSSSSQLSSDGRPPSQLGIPALACAGPNLTFCCFFFSPPSSHPDAPGVSHYSGFVESALALLLSVS